MKSPEVNPINQDIPLRVFVSSPYEDMISYRDIVIEALTSIEQLPIGMQHFVSSTDEPLEVCLTDVRRCQLCIVLLGMRYGSIDGETGKSYTELEYEEAIKNKIPVLSFVIDENNCPILPKFVDTGTAATKLIEFKNKLDKQYTSRFKSENDLKTLVVRAVKAQLERNSQKVLNEKHEIALQADYISGARIFKNFLLLPERYQGKEVVLRIKMQNGFSTWMRRKAFTDAFGLKDGDTLVGNDAAVIGVDLSDIDSRSNSKRIDFYAEGKNADWILEKGVTNGTVFEGKFKFSYETVRNATSEGDVKIAALILLEGKVIIGQEEPMKVNDEDSEDIKNVDETDILKALLDSLAKN